MIAFLIYCFSEKILVVLNKTLILILVYRLSFISYVLVITVFNALLILYVSFFSTHANTDGEQFVKDLVWIGEHKSSKYNEEEITSVKDKKLDFYVSANSGKIYYNNSKTFVNGIKAIGERFISLINTANPNLSLQERLGLVFIKTGLVDEIQSIEKFNGKIDFQWLKSVSLGYYAGKNGRVDFEAMYSAATIEDSNSPLIFDKSASVFAFLLNFYYNPNIQSTQFAPYIGLGIGPATFRLKKINGSLQNSMPLNVPWFAYQIKLGINYSIIPEVKTFFGYRYFNIPTPVADCISTHNIEVGLMFNF
ncbi:MAG: P44/Msp2 family outer membrane protein [Wolbachia sp.]